MLEYTQIKRNSRRFLALTGLTVKEFKMVLPVFTEVYQEKFAGRKTHLKRTRKRQPGGGRKGSLASPAQKLLFILVYQKTYPLQVVLGELFGFSQAAANAWIHRLLPILLEALRRMGVVPERNGRKFAQAERKQPEAVVDYIIDGTERRRQRPKQSKKQALHYSGKKKVHTDKNVLIVHTRSKRVGYLSPTYVGKTHDKKVADQERIVYPRRATLRQDTGFQSYAPPVKQNLQAKKSLKVNPSSRVRNAITAPCRACECALSTLSLE